MPHLPPEVVAHIISYLDEYSLELRACSLVSRDWLPFTRERIFHRAVITPVHCLDDVAFFGGSPHLASHVRELVVIWQTFDVTSRKDAMSRLHTLFPNILRLSLATTPRTRWDRMPNMVESSFQRLVASPSLRTLALASWRFSEAADELAGLLRSSSASLEVLSLRQLYISWELVQVTPNPALRIVLPKLRSIQLTSSRGYSPIGQYHLSTPELESLTWSSDALSLRYLPMIVPTSSLSRLSSMTLTLMFDNPGDPEPIEATAFLTAPWHLPNLRSLNIELDYPFYSQSFSLSNAVQRAADCITKIPSPRVLEYLALSFREAERYADDPVWEQLDAQLVHLRRHGALRSVFFRPPIPEARLPGLQSLGILYASGAAMVNDE